MDAITGAGLVYPCHYDAAASEDERGRLPPHPQWHSQKMGAWCPGGMRISLRQIVCLFLERNENKHDLINRSQKFSHSLPIGQMSQIWDYAPEKNL